MRRDLGEAGTPVEQGTSMLAGYGTQPSPSMPLFVETSKTTKMCILVLMIMVVMAMAFASYYVHGMHGNFVAKISVVSS